MTERFTGSGGGRSIAVIGTGISGLSAAWLLAKTRNVTVYEADDRIGGHSNTVEIDVGGRSIAVDTGFIVYNEPCYPNLTALFAHLGVETVATDMSFAVSIDRGRLEYAGSDLAGLLAQPANLVKPRFWSMMADLLRFYREAPRDLATMGDVSLADWLDAHRYGRAFREDHLYPMAAAIWSTPSAEVGDYPAAAFVRFCENHGLLRLTGRPVWRTVKGGSREYVARLTASFRDRILTSTPVVSVARDAAGVEVVDATGARRRFDDVVIATHADRALALLADPSAEERRLLGAFRYSKNEAVLHSDVGLMPRRRAAWASWNYLSDAREGDRALSVTYWMNRLQPLGDAPELFVTLNPLREPDPSRVHARIAYDHPLFDAATGRAQTELWSLQGANRTWFSGAHFGAGFHEDGLQAGLAVAEDLGGGHRPWTVANDSARIHRTPLTFSVPTREAAE
jgi:predicted NAD/FAD-binding protein